MALSCLVLARSRPNGQLTFAAETNWMSKNFSRSGVDGEVGVTNACVPLCQEFVCHLTRRASFMDAASSLYQPVRSCDVRLIDRESFSFPRRRCNVNLILGSSKKSTVEQRFAAFSLST